jgi:hypothetical protein
MDNLRCKCGRAKICGVQRHATRNLFIRGVDVQDAVVAVADPYNFRHSASEWRFRGVAGLGIEEVPGRCRLCCSPIVLGLRKQCSILIY